MRDGMYRKRDAVLYPYLPHQLGHVRLDGAFLDAESGADFLVRSARGQQFESFLLPVGKGCPTDRKDAPARIAHAFNEQGKHSAWSPDRALADDPYRLREIQPAMPLRPRSPWPRRQWPCSLPPG